MEAATSVYSVDYTSQSRLWAARSVLDGRGPHSSPQHHKDRAELYKTVERHTRRRYTVSYAFL